MTDRAYDVEGLRSIVKAMRALGVTRWNGIELGPDPLAETPSEQTYTPPEVTEAREREERRRVAYASSGGLVLRLTREAR